MYCKKLHAWWSTQSRFVFYFHLYCHFDLISVHIHYDPANKTLIVVIFMKHLGRLNTITSIYTTLTNFGTTYLVLCNVCTDVGGIK